MLYAAVCRDTKEAPRLRHEVLARHGEHFRKIRDRVRLVAPFSERDGIDAMDFGSFAGSLFIVEAGSLDDARTLIESDPYFQEGVWEEPRVYFVPACSGLE